MARSHFAVGLAVGSLAGMAIGYLMSKNGQLEAEPPAGTIDLTPTIEAEERRAAAAASDRPARGRRAEAQSKETEE